MGLVLMLYVFLCLISFRRPVKAALSAAAEHLAGLLPLHLVYSHVHETAVEVCLNSDVRRCVTVCFPILSPFCIMLSFLELLI